MVHVATPDIVPAGRPPYGYLVISRRGHQAKQSALRWWAMALELFFLRNFRTSDQT